MTNTTTGRAPARQNSVRRYNLSLILHHVSANSPLSRAALADATGLTKATISSLVSELLRAELLVERGDRPTGSIGRPGTLLELNRQGPVSVGLEINVDYIAICVTDLGHNVRYRQIEQGDNKLAATQVLDRATCLAATAMHQVRQVGLTPYGVGVALPGVVDPEGGALLNAPNLDWPQLPVVEMLAPRLGIPPTDIHLDNEANFAALGELWVGNGTQWGDYVYVSAETGIGAGIVSGGAIHYGAHGAAGEIGHITVNPSGPPCRCGGRGCLERLAGQEAILKAAGLPASTLTTSIGNPQGPLQKLDKALAAHQPDALSALHQAGASLGIGLANVVNIIDPDTIVLGGIYTALAPWLTSPVTETLQQQAVSARSIPQIATSTLGGEAATRGAAALVIQHLLNVPRSSRS